MDGEVVFDKAGTGRMPEAGEAAASVEARLGSPLAWRRTHPAS